MHFCQKEAAMTRGYQVVERKDGRAAARYLNGDGRVLLPMLELIEPVERAADERIDVACGAWVPHPSLRAKGGGRTGGECGFCIMFASSVPHPCYARMGHPPILAGKESSAAIAAVVTNPATQSTRRWRLVSASRTLGTAAPEAP